MDESGVHLSNQTTAVLGQDVWKSYGSGTSKIFVLRNLNIRVTQRTIYGLLGPSGCGKTTLLRCILGRLEVDSGKITVLGKPPNTPGHGIPGNQVGYMPQEAALYAEFSMKDHLMYFGKLHGMRKEKIEERTEFLVQLLNLPSPNKLARELSGGQHRRVSFAVALLQEPALLILDEPTVGVDPLLRASIWKHLKDIVSETQTSIIITTHYIEEARQADLVGLMRDGRILAEAPPDQLMTKYCSATLEEVFLTLCRGVNAEGCKYGAASTESIEERSSEGAPGGGSFGNGPPQQGKKASTDDTRRKSILGKSVNALKGGCGLAWASLSSCQAPTFTYKALQKSFTNFFAMTLKNVIKYKRNLGLLVFQFVIPTIQIVLFCLAIGGDLHHLPVTIVNEDQGLFPDHQVNVGELYVQSLENSTMHKKYASNIAAGREQVIKGHSWAVIHMEKNFSANMLARVKEGIFASNETIYGSRIKIAMDATNEQIAIVLEASFEYAYEVFSKKALRIFSKTENPDVVGSGVQFGHHIYGKEHSKSTYYMAPGVLVSIAFSKAVSLTAVTLILERKEGLLDRSWVAGVNVFEVVLAHAVTQLFIIAVQMGLMVFSLLVVFQIPCEGNVIFVLLLVVLQGLVGMTAGLLISAICETELAAVQIALGMFYPVLLLSGIVWPSEAMPKWLLYISYGLPTTYAAKSMRSIMGRGWGLDWQVVWTGYLIASGWLVLLLFLSVVALSRRK